MLTAKLNSKAAGDRNRSQVWTRLFMFCQDLFLLHLHIKDSVLMIRYTTILYYKHKYIVSEKDLLTVDLYAHTQWNNHLCPTPSLCRRLGRGFESLHSAFFVHQLSEHCQQSLQTNAKFKGVKEKIKLCLWSCWVKRGQHGERCGGKTDSKRSTFFMFLLTLFVVFLRLWMLLDTPRRF